MRNSQYLHRQAYVWSPERASHLNTAIRTSNDSTSTFDKVLVRFRVLKKVVRLPHCCHPGIRLEAGQSRKALGIPLLAARQLP
jgi:hypothetical protein